MTSTMRAVWTVCAFACCLSFLTIAYADSPVGGVVAVGGSAPERDREVVGAAVATAARSAGWRLPPKALSKQDVDALVNCAAPAAPWTCVPASVNALGIQHALVVVVEPRQSEGGVPVLALVGKAFAASPATLVAHQRLCPHCADDKLAEASTELTVQLLNELATRSGRTLIEVSSAPSNAIVAIDGQPTGGTNDTFNTFPGPHVVVIEKAGFLPETVKVVAEEGKTATVSVTLRPAPRPAGPSLLLPAGAVAGGTVLVATGLYVAIHYSQDGPDDLYRYRRPVLIGSTISGIGLGAVGVGVYLWWRGRKEPLSTPTIQSTSGGAVIGWVTAF